MTTFEGNCVAKEMKEAVSHRLVRHVASFLN